MGTRADRSPSRYPQHRHSPPQRKRHYQSTMVEGEGLQGEIPAKTEVS